MKRRFFFFLSILTVILGCSEPQPVVVPEKKQTQVNPTQPLQSGPTEFLQTPPHQPQPNTQTADDRRQNVQSEDCAQCHAKEYDLWKDSFHARTMNHATPETVLGNFQNVQLSVVGFNDLLRLTDPEIAVLLQSDRKTEPSPDNRSERKSEPYPESLTSLILDLAIALQETQPGIRTGEIREKLMRNMDQAEQDELQRQLDHRDRIGFTRPVEIVIAQKRIVERLQRLSATGQINLDFGVPFRFSRQDGQFFIATENQQGQFENFPISYVLGIKSLQQYLVTLPDGRIQCLPVSWDIKGNHWINQYPQERILPDDPLHWSRTLQNWNNMCAACHVTEFRKNFDLKTNRYHSEWSGLNVGCLTCHIDRTVDEPITNTNLDRNSETATQPAPIPKCYPRISLSLSPSNTIKADFGFLSCLDCHARRRVLVEGSLLPGEDFLDRFNPELPGRTCYYADGQLREENFEYGSFMQSRMSFMQVRCDHCHDPHSLALKHEGNRLCTQCHSPDLYDTPRHHFHNATSIPHFPIQCIDCHAPPAIYMLVDKRHDHYFKKPQPELTMALGMPNACNLCHFDAQKGEDALWAYNQMENWYSDRRRTSVGFSQAPPPDAHFAFAIEQGRNADPAGIIPLIVVARNTDGREIRSITRANAVSLLGHYNTSESIAAIKTALTDPEGIVRLAAVEASESLPQHEQLTSLTPLLTDPIRAVRAETARVLAPIPKSRFTETAKQHWINAAREYLTMLKVIEDTPQSHLNLGIFRYHLVLEQLSDTTTPDLFRTATNPVLQTYQTSLLLEPSFIPSRINLAMLYNERSESEKAENEFRNVLTIDPTMGEAYYSLALLLTEQNRFRESLDLFRQAITLLPDRPRVRYNYGLALMKLEQWDQAESELKRALADDPHSNDIQQALLFLNHSRSGR